MQVVCELTYVISTVGSRVGVGGLLENGVGNRSVGGVVTAVMSGVSVDNVMSIVVVNVVGAGISGVVEVLIVFVIVVFAPIV